MDELDKLRQEIEILKNRMTYLEETLATIADMSKSGEMGQYIAQRQRALAASKLVNAAAGTQKLNADAQQQVIDQLAAEKAAMDARIEEAIRASAQNIPAEDDLAEQFTYRDVPGGVEIQGYTGFDVYGKFVIPEKIKDKIVIGIGQNAFINMRFESVILPETLQYIGDFAFKNTRLKNIKCPNDLVNIGDGAFENCKELTTLQLSNNINYLGSGSFSGSGLTEVMFPENLKTIDRMCFYGCKNLKRVVLNKNLQYIGMSAFAETDISPIIIPSSVKEIDDGAIDGIARVAVLGMKTQFRRVPRMPVAIYCLAGSEVQKQARLGGAFVKSLDEFRNIR